MYFPPSSPPLSNLDHPLSLPLYWYTDIYNNPLQLYTEYVKDYHITMEGFNKCLQEEPVFEKHVEIFEGTYWD